MKVLMLSPEYPPHVVGGLGKHVCELAEHLVKKGTEIYIVTPGYPGSPGQEVINGVRIVRAPLYQVSPLGFVDSVLQSNLGLVEVGASLLGRIGGFSLIHAHDWLVGFAAKTLKHAYKLPLLATIHATEQGRNHGIHNELQNYIHKAEWLLTYEAWKVICCSQYMKEEVERVFTLPQDKIVVLPNGIDTKKYEGGDELGGIRNKYAADQEKVVLFVGRLVHEKGAHVLLEAFPGILAAVPEAKLVIVGKGGEKAALEEKARQLGISHKVYFTGYLADQDLLCLYKFADVAVFPSFYEPFGIVALEAMASGTPVIISDTGGLKEIIVDGLDGLKVYPGDSWTLGEKIITILQNREMAKRLATQAKQKVKDIFEWQKIALDTKHVYLDIASKRKKSSWISPLEGALAVRQRGKSRLGEEQECRQ